MVRTMMRGHTRAMETDYCIQEVNVLDLILALDDSVDKYVDDWRDLWDNKYDEAAGYLVDDILAHGFLHPVCVVVDRRGWTLGNGNHRLSVAFRHYFDTIPVVFQDKDRDYMLTEITSPDE